MNPGLYYKHSGKFGATAPLLYLVVGGAAAAVGGFAYGWLAALNPLIYINFLLMFLVAGGIGLACHFASISGKVRNTGLCSLCALLVGILAVYFAWVGWMRYTLGGEIDAPWDPRDIFTLQRLMAATGVWSMKSFTPTGWVLWSFWGVEALCIVITTVAVAAGSLMDRPFDEASGEWVDVKYEVGPLAVVAEPDAVKAAAEQGDLEPILGLPMIAPADAFTKLLLRHNPSNTFFVATLNAVTMKDDGKGNKSESATAIFENLIVAPGDFAALLEMTRREAPAAVEPSEGASGASGAQQPQAG